MTKEGPREGTHTLVVALGGNAILRRGDDGTIETQLKRSDEAMGHIARLIGTGRSVAITHGNQEIGDTGVILGLNAYRPVPRRKR